MNPDELKWWERIKQILLAKPSDPTDEGYQKQQAIADARERRRPYVEQIRREPVRAVDDALTGAASGALSLGLKALTLGKAKTATERLEAAVPATPMGQLGKTAGSLGAEFSPAGDVASGVDMVNYAREGNLPMAALAALGTAPLVPAVHRLVHYGKGATADFIDPKFAGTGPIKGEERRIKEAWPEDHIDGTYFFTEKGLEEMPLRQRMERGLASLPMWKGDVEAEILPEESFQQFVDNARKSLTDAGELAIPDRIIARAQKLAHAAGFDGMVTRPGVIKLWKPIPTAPPKPHLTPDAPDLGEVANTGRARMQQRVREYVGRDTNSAPGTFGGARFLTKEEGLDEEFAAEVARVYGRAKSTPDDPATQAAYAQFAKEIDEQFDFVTNELGIKMEATADDPYRGPRGGPDSRLMAQDVFENNRLRVFTGGSDHPLLTPEQNVKFRFIHDVLGHAMFGNTFAARGEEGAFRAHAEMFSDLARQAMATETRGQNSWVNFGPNRHLPASQRPFAEQKVFILPEELRATEPGNIPAAQRADIRERQQTSNAAARAARVAELESVLTPEELAEFQAMKSDTRENTLTAFSRSPSPRALASGALEGASEMGWYKVSGESLFESFGDDAPRFTALLAATSPNKSVEENLKIALETWGNWVQAGRPSDPDAIRALGAWNLPADEGNAIRALMADPERLLQTNLRGLLSGPKVDPFYSNLMGETQRVVNDTHMARVFGTSTKGPATLSRNLAMTASVRRAAQEIERLTGTKVEPREAQEMIWAFIRGLTNASGDKGDMVETLARAMKDPSALLTGNKTLQQRIQDSVSFGDLMARPEYREMLQRAGVRAPTPRRPAGFPGQIPPGAKRPRDLFDLAGRGNANRAGTPIFSIGALLGVREMRERERSRR